MATKRQVEAINLYASIMEEIKIRMDCAIGAIGGRSNLIGPLVRELCFLQFRMIAELIALGALVAHGDISSSQKLRKEYSADRIIAQLEALHPDFFPQPIKITSPGTAGAHHDIRGPLSSDFGLDYLSKKELLELYGRCGDALHRGSLKKLLSPKTPIQTNFPNLTRWLQKIEYLLGNHMIVLHGGTTAIICSLRNPANQGRVQVAIAEHRAQP
jgi:hypothetical protein